MHVAVDVGGTFTDLVVLTDGDLETFKVPTGAEPHEGVLAGLDRVDPDRVTHASTVAANALIEDDETVALVTTSGFADVVEIGTQARLDLYDLAARKPPQLVPKHLRFEVDERIDADGGALESPTQRDLDDVVRDLHRVDVDAVAVCTLFSHLDDAHEQAVADRLRDAGYTVSASSDISPKVREYPRTVTTVADAKVQRPVRDYVDRLRDRLGETPLHMMRSDGGICDPDRYLDAPVRGVLSGPVGGVTAAEHLADRLDLDRVLTLDMGGTSADLARVGPEGAETTHEFAFHDLPIRIPAVEIHTLGAGGGSVADLDPAGALVVGPDSAGSDPGPACYGRGGDQPTVTDADLVAGWVDPDAFPEGIDPTPDRARQVLEELADRAGLGLDRTVRGIRRVVEDDVAHGAREVTLAKGHDPRRHALVAYGGAGPLHTCPVAETIGIERVVVPPVPGVFSALGLLVAEPIVEQVQGVAPTTDLDDLAPVVEELSEAVVAETRGLGDTLRKTVRVDARYVGQAHELTVPLEGMPESFHDAHERARGLAHPDLEVEVVAVRVTGRVPRDPPALPGPSATGSPEPIDHRDVLWDETRQKTPAYRRDDLPADWTADGPLIVHDPGSTTAVPPGWGLTVDPTGSLVLEAT